jgi:hypothetical protein
MLSKHLPKRGYQYQPQHRRGTVHHPSKTSHASMIPVSDRCWTVSRIDHRPVSRPQLIIMPDLEFLQTDSPSPPTQHRTAGRSDQRMHFLSLLHSFIIHHDMRLCQPTPRQHTIHTHIKQQQQQQHKLQIANPIITTPSRYPTLIPNAQRNKGKKKRRRRRTEKNNNKRTKRKEKEPNLS